jgi:signal transduction histidine kinase
MTADPQAQSGSAAPRLARAAFRGPFARWPRTSDAALAVVTFLATVFLTENPDQDLSVRALTDVPLPAFGVFAVASGALLWRRKRPLEVMAVTMAAWGVSLAFGFGGVPAQGVAVYSAGRYVTDRRWSGYGLAASVAVTVVDAASSGPLTDVPIAVFLTFALWYAGVRVRNRGERSALLARERVAEERRVLAEERARIARELHDVVAHRVSMMTVQAGAAKTVAVDDPQAAVAAMAAVEQAGREALSELRHLLGVLRPDTESGGLGPQPGLADVPRLVEEFQAAGLDVSLTTNGLVAGLPAQVDLSAYRIVQEALTNVLKHAGPGTRTQVRLTIDGRHDDHHLAVHVLDDGNGSPVLPWSGGGRRHGIVGMRERALLLGGRLDAGPRPGGGFQVDAHLPVGPVESVGEVTG